MTHCFMDCDDGALRVILSYLFLAFCLPLLMAAMLLIVIQVSCSICGRRRCTRLFPVQSQFLLGWQSEDTSSLSKLSKQERREIYEKALSCSRYRDKPNSKSIIKGCSEKDNIPPSEEVHSISIVICEDTHTSAQQSGQPLDDQVNLTADRSYSKHELALLKEQEDTTCEEQHPACAICLGEYKEDDLILSSSHCSHIFHKECLLVWLENKEFCPYCRQCMLTPEEIKLAYDRGRYIGAY